MDNEEFNKLCEEAKAQGLEDKDILAILFEAFKKGDLEKEELEKLAGAMGYETTEEFKSLIDDATEEAEAPAEKGAEGITEEEVEDAQEVEKGEGEEAEGKEEDASEEEKSDDKEMSEDEEKEEARKLFDLD